METGWGFIRSGAVALGRIDDHELPEHESLTRICTVHERKRFEIVPARKRS